MSQLPPKLNNTVMRAVVAALEGTAHDEVVTYAMAKFIATAAVQAALEEITHDTEAAGNGLRVPTRGALTAAAALSASPPPPPETTIRGKALDALRAAERAIDDCQNYRSHLHHKELEIVRDAIRSLIGTAPQNEEVWQWRPDANVLEVVQSAYGWQIDDTGGVAGLTAGDMGYEWLGATLHEIVGSALLHEAERNRAETNPRARTEPVEDALGALVKECVKRLAPPAAPVPTRQGAE